MLEGISMTPVQSLNKKMSGMHHQGHPGEQFKGGMGSMNSSPQMLPPEVLAAMSGSGPGRRNIKIRAVGQTQDPRESGQDFL